MSDSDEEDECDVNYLGKYKTVWSSSSFSIHWRECKFPTLILLEHTPKLVKMTTFTRSHKPTWASCLADDIKIDW